MSNIWFLLLAVICWQPIYLFIMFLFHTVKGDTIDRAAYWGAAVDWFGKLLGLVISKPQV